jgi:hypothetical protein
MGRERAFWAGPCEQLAGARGFGPALSAHERRGENEEAAN